MGNEEAVIGLPLRVEDITADWLSEALTANADKDVRVDAISVRDIIWGTATKVLLDVQYGAGGNGLPDSLCVKGGFVAEMLAQMASGYQGEVRFYRDIAPHLSHGIADCYFAGEEASTGQGVIVLEDVTRRGATFPQAPQSLSVDQVAAGLETLAGLHDQVDLAAGWAGGVNTYRPLLDAMLVHENVTQFDSDRSEGPFFEVSRDKQRLMDAFRAGWADEDRHTQTLIHGDANVTNIYLDASGIPSFLDWQFACRGDAYHDVTFFAVGALAVEDRRAHEQDLLRSYLSARCVAVDPLDTAWAAYRRRLVHGTMYGWIPNEMQPPAVRYPLADRYAQAILDHDTLSLLGV